jgi:hypothetical protein
VQAKWWGATVLSLVAVAWGGAGYLVTKPVDFHDYRVAAVGSAQAAHDALSTVALVAEARRQGRVMTPYAESTFDDARRALAGAAKQFTGVEPPDAACQAMHDELAPLLQKADRELPEVAAGEPDEVSDALEAFVERHT